MTIRIQTAIYLGNYTDADTDESTPGVEVPAVYTQTFGSATNPLSTQSYSVVEVSYDDKNDDNLLSADHHASASAEEISYNIGTNDTAKIDSIVTADITVTYTDGTTVNLTGALLYQDAKGNLFLANPGPLGIDTSTLQSITVTALTDSTATDLPLNSICFAAGTRILTTEGDRLIEELRVGDLVITLDHGPQPIRWIGSSMLRCTEKTFPVHIPEGSLGEGLPDRDLLVSQQHRMLIRSRIAERVAHSPEVLVPAKALAGYAGIRMAREIESVRYFHIMCDSHEIVRANGTPAETLLCGPQALRMMGTEARDELRAIFPLLETECYGLRPVRTDIRGSRAAHLLARHAKNSHPLVDMSPSFAQQSDEKTVFLT